MNENPSVQNAKNEPEKSKKKFSEKSFGGKILTIVKWIAIGYVSVAVLLVIIGLLLPTPDNKEVSSTKDDKKIETSEEKEEPDETPEPEDTSQEEVIEEEPVVEESEPEIETYYSRYPDYYHVGEPHTYNMSGGSTVEFTVTGLGYSYEETFIEFHIKNTGNTQTTFGSNNFRVYADNMAVEIDYFAEGMYTSETLDPGRELVGKIYAKIGMNQFNVLELDMGSDSSTYIIYDAELEAIAEEYERANYTGYVNAEFDLVMQNFSGFMEAEEIPADKITGHYVDRRGGTGLVKDVTITIYSSPDESNGCVGEISFYYNKSDWIVQFHYYGENYYYGGGFDEPGVDFASSTIPGFEGEPDNCYVTLYIDGKSAGTLIKEQ